MGVLSQLLADKIGVLGMRGIYFGMQAVRRCAPNRPRPTAVNQQEVRVMSSAFHRGDQSGANARASERPAEPEAGAALGSHMLDQILSLTSGGEPQAGFVEPADVQPLMDVARSLASVPFVLEPVAVELIHAVLQVQFQKAGLKAEQVRAMARQIATTLCDDPASRSRLESLWNALVERVS